MGVRWGRGFAIEKNEKITFSLYTGGRHTVGVLPTREGRRTAAVRGSQEGGTIETRAEELEGKASSGMSKPRPAPEAFPEP